MMKKYIVILLVLLVFPSALFAQLKTGYFIDSGFSLGARVGQNFSFIDSSVDVTDDFRGSESANGINIRAGYNFVDWRLAISYFSWTTDVSKTDISALLISVDYVHYSGFFVGLGQGSGTTTFASGGKFFGSSYMFDFGYKITSIHQGFYFETGFVYLNFATNKVKISEAQKDSLNFVSGFDIKAIYLKFAYGF